MSRITEETKNSFCGEFIVSKWPSSKTVVWRSFLNLNPEMDEEEIIEMIFPDYFPQESVVWEMDNIN
jgi:hypothetical protein